MDVGSDIDDNDHGDGDEKDHGDGDDKDHGDGDGDPTWEPRSVMVPENSWLIVTLLSLTTLNSPCIRYEAGSGCCWLCCF